MTKKIILSTFISTVILFLWSGLTQMFPWGVPTAQTISTQSNKQTKSFQTPNLIELPPNSLTTEKFDEQFVNKISTLTTDKTFSWIITSPIDNYNVSTYFIKEVITQFLVGLFLGLILSLTVQLTNKTRLILIGLSGILAVTAIYGQMMNWWGLPSIYALGAGFNLIVGWLIAGLISTKFIIKSENQ
ncbi:MAG: hypothetical protein ABIM30_09120 [candidate division WOR-3 bacterium]